MGGKGKLLWLIRKLAPPWYPRFIDVFGGSGTVTLDRPVLKGCLEVYNDYNSNLTNLFCCVKNRTMALLKELGFLPLNSRDDFEVLLKFFSKDEFIDDYMEEELELTQVYLKPPEREMIRKLLLERSPRGGCPAGGGLLQADPLQLQRGRKSVCRKAVRHPPLLPSDLGVLKEVG